MKLALIILWYTNLLLTIIVFFLTILMMIQKSHLLEIAGGIAFTIGWLWLSKVAGIANREYTNNGGHWNAKGEQ